MAVEDGAALAEALSHATSPSQLPTVLAVFERVRALRSSQMQRASLINGKLWHFADGPEQEARDLASRSEVLGEPFEESSNQWSDPLTQEWTFGYDTEGAIRREMMAFGLVKH
jgi:salicylate hydroxylase